MARKSAFLWFLFLGLVGVSCSKKQDPELTQPVPTQAPSNVHDSLAVKAIPSGEVGLDSHDVLIQRSSLGKDFLLQASLVIQPGPMGFSGLRSMVVRFVERNGSLYLFESPKGNSFVKNQNAELLIAEFKIKSEKDSWIQFDFDAGMKKLFVSADWATSDYSGPDYSEARWQSANIGKSLISKAEIAGNILWLTQTGALEMPSSYLPVKVEYYLTPYLVNSQFTPTLSTSYHQFGFFEANPIFDHERSQSISHATKFDASKAIVFAISDNTPADYRDAVREGVLYWNKAFGRDVVQVIDAPAGVTAPHPLYNVLQWMDFDSAGFAYADAQMDPWTGEIQHAQIYFTSSWVKYGKTHGAALTSLKYQSEARAQSEKKKGNLVSLNGFHSHHIGGCGFDLNQHAREISALVAGGTSVDQLERIARDMVRTVVAHEVGHTLGLRHNFAGSSATNFAPSRELVFKNYVQTGNLASNLIAGSSTMDYPSFIEDIVIGRQLVTEPKALSYDTAAIQHLYNGKHYEASEVPAFCTDSSVGRFSDCFPGDYGKNVAEYAALETPLVIRELPRTMLGIFIEHKKFLNNLPANSVKPQLTLPSPGLWAYSNLASARLFLSTLSRDIRSVNTVKKDPSFLSPEFEEDRKLDHALQLNESLNTLGGFAGILSLPNSKLLESLSNEFLQLTNKESTAQLFTESEIKAVQTRGLSWLKSYSKAYNLNLVRTISGAAAGGSWKHSEQLREPMDKFADYLLSVGVEVIGSVSSEGNLAAAKVTTPCQTSSAPALVGVSAGPGSSLTPACDQSWRQNPVFPEFTYDSEVRKAAASILDGASESSIWGLVQKESLGKQMRDRYNYLMGGNFSKLEESVFKNRPVLHERFLLEKFIYDSLPASKDEPQEPAPTAAPASAEPSVTI